MAATLQQRLVSIEQTTAARYAKLLAHGIAATISPAEEMEFVDLGRRLGLTFQQMREHGNAVVKLQALAPLAREAPTRGEDLAAARAAVAAYDAQVDRENEARFAECQALRANDSPNTADRTAAASKAEAIEKAARARYPQVEATKKALRAKVAELQAPAAEAAGALAECREIFAQAPAILPAVADLLELRIPA